MHCYPYKICKHHRIHGFRISILLLMIPFWFPSNGVCAESEQQVTQRSGALLKAAHQAARNGDKKKASKLVYQAMEIRKTKYPELPHLTMRRPI